MQEKIAAINLRLEQTVDTAEKVALTVELGLYTHYRDPHAAYELGSAALKLAREINDDRLIAESLRLQGVCSNVLNDHKRALTLLLDAQALAEKLKNRELDNKILVTLGSIYIADEQYAAALSVLEKCLSITPENDVRYTASAISGIASVYERIGREEEAFRQYLRIISLHEPLPLGSAQESITSKISAYNNIGNMYHRLGDYAEALPYFEKALTLSVDNQLLHIQAKILGNIGIAHLEIGDGVKALEYLQESQRMLTDLGAESDIPNVSENIGRAYIELNEIDKGLKRLFEVVESPESAVVPRQRAMALAHIGEAYIRRDEYRDALPYLKRAQESLSDTSLLSIAIDCHVSSLIALAYEKLGDYKQAFSHQKRHKELSDQYEDAELRRNIVKLKAQYDISKIKREKEFMETEVRHLEKELTQLSLSQARYNAIVRKMNKELKEIGNTGNLSIRAIVNDLIDNIEKSLAENQASSHFHHKFDRLHKEFLHILAKRFPTLTSTELTICTLLRLQLSTKAIADFLFLSQRTVDRHRNSIRKKIGISPKTDLATFLNTM